MLDRINSSGFYTQRIRQLGSFGPGGLAARPALDIADPLYAKMTHGAEHAALRAAVHDIAAACRHLVGSLAQLKARCVGWVGRKGLDRLRGAIFFVRLVRVAGRRLMHSRGPLPPIMSVLLTLNRHPPDHPPPPSLSTARVPPRA